MRVKIERVVFELFEVLISEGIAYTWGHNFAFFDQMTYIKHENEEKTHS